MSRLKQLREEKNLTQDELSELSGISVRTIQRIEAGTEAKGYTRKTLAKALSIPEEELLGVKKTDQQESAGLSIQVGEDTDAFQIAKMKWINLSSLLFILLPPLNIIIPMVLGYYLKQKNLILKQIITLQMLWTIFAPIVFFIGIFLKLGNGFALFLMVSIVMINVLIILGNAIQLDRKQRLFFQFNFNLF